MHPRLKLTKHFFFPGFNEKTGGLLRERGLVEECARFQADPAAMAAFLARFGVTQQEMDALKVSLFCYPFAQVAELLQVWEHGGSPVTCLVPEGVAVDAVQDFLGAEGKAGAARTRGALTVRVLPFVPQTDYDKLLWACDLNFVRGEDSWVRAQWAARPFIWHIYLQDENLHHKKLRAFLQRYAAGIESLVAFSLHWNGAVADGPADWPALWHSLREDMPNIAARTADWQAEVVANGDLASNLLTFVNSLR
jgi:uncharacterized repeat protein (TIGR03837 family)